ncbi:cytochrome-c peroxidase [Roseobacter sinensis]|uniref:Cytochrome-c peroxidase n=1 Tax=Roseobacter sinensis TaxID=2931391 RepID=A0ABT3BHW6_9RHOB|nr:cytochrome c peroxidase [Roseobacter sp. WL0113]MCV3273162.1 cytochrome-c peroxidase [Roseobacter sp. WL0113]
MVRALATAMMIGLGPAMAGDLPAPVTDADYMPVDAAQVRLGHLLFYDPILSGNRNISCATCHHPKFATADGVALSLGEGGIGLGPERRATADNTPEQRIPRNAPALFNLGAHEFTVMFHDGRIEVDESKPGGLRTPMGAEMTEGFANLLSAQTMFPVLSADEMAGHYSENDVSEAVRQGRITGEGGAWDLLSRRVAETPGYAPLIEAAFPDSERLSFTEISDAIAAFVAFEWRSDSSLFDAYLRGQADLPPEAELGRQLFYGEAGCSTCHAGAFQTDHAFHAMGVPQFGPGKAARFESHVRDVGRMRVTGQASDAYAFRTPSLRNVTRTGPYGHTGSHSDLAAFIADHIDPKSALDRFDPAQVDLPGLPGVEDWQHLQDPAEQNALRAAINVEPRRLSTTDITALVAFLDTLDDAEALAGRLGIPDSVPSGLPVDR